MKRPQRRNNTRKLKGEKEREKEFCCVESAFRNICSLLSCPTKFYTFFSLSISSHLSSSLASQRARFNYFVFLKKIAIQEKNPSVQ